MNFSDKLNQYISLIHCSSKELAKECGLSEAIISHYRKGKRIPGSCNLEKLSVGLAKLSLEKYDKKVIFREFLDSLNKRDINFQVVSGNLNCLIQALHIHAGEMAKFLNFDASYLSKIRKGERIPSNKMEFIQLVATFTYKKCDTKELKEKISLLINCTTSELTTKQIEKWLTCSHKEDVQSVGLFLQKLDEFDLENYIRVIHFDTLKIPNIPFYHPKEKNYYGLEEMKRGELDFFKAAVFSKSKEDIFMCSDMDMEDMACDTDFAKKWMFAIAASLKKGLHLNIIHQVNRPFNEMMLGLESWIPIYMTGQVTPYYLPNYKNLVYQHLNYTSGTVALVGESIQDYHKDGKYFLATNRKDVEYYKKKSQFLLKKSRPLMEIYTKEKKRQYQLFLLEDSNSLGMRTRILSSLPLFTISKELLIEILNRTSISKDDSEIILKAVQLEKERYQKILSHDIICDTLEIFEKEKFSQNTPYLSLENIFYPQKINYTFEEYDRHLKDTLNYAKRVENYKINFVKNHTFKNISISSVENDYVIISKVINPSIHFVIKHPKLLEAILNFKPLVQDE